MKYHFQFLLPVFVFQNQRFECDISFVSLQQLFYDADYNIFFSRDVGVAYTCVKPAQSIIYLSR